MKFQVVFGLILLILVVVGILVGAPYLINLIKENQFLSFSGTGTNQGFSLTERPLTYVPSAPSAVSQPAVSVAPGESLFKGRVAISSVSRFGSQQISLRAAYGAEPVDITGWRIKSEKRGETVIGRGIGLPHFEGASDVLLGGSETAEIYTGLSPLGSSFRVNDCFGWLSNLYNLGYSLSYCPRIQLAELGGLDSACQELILNTSCRAPAADVLNNYSAQCRNWVDQNLNYGACVNKYKTGANFY